MTWHDPPGSDPGPPATGISEALAEDLRDLAGDLVAGGFTTSSASMLRRDLRLAVRSLLGFTLTFGAAGPPVSVAINVLDEPLEADQVADSLVLQLPVQSKGFSASVAVYAGVEHDLDDLRGDLAFAFDIPLTAAIPMGSRAGTIVPGISGLGPFAVVHQSVGVLLTAGHTRTSAAVELVRQAHEDPEGVLGAARLILEQAARPAVTVVGAAGPGSAEAGG